jgi:hypothetical protein
MNWGASTSSAATTWQSRPSTHSRTSSDAQSNGLEPSKSAAKSDADAIINAIEEHIFVFVFIDRISG